MNQLTLFTDAEMGGIARPRAKRPTGGSANPIIFHDYDSFVAKFKDNPKTTDDTFTPKDVYEAVVQYVCSVTDMTDKVILRPFYPGGDYENADYPENGVVIDNPPFSIFTKICAFYTMHNIPFFLFGPGLTIGSCTKYCTAVIIGNGIIFENGANVKCNFASNLFGDMLIMTAPTLDAAIEACPSQNIKANLPTYAYPDVLLSVSDMQTIAKGGVDFSVSRHECAVCRKLDNHPASGGLFGDHWLISKAKAKAKAKANIEYLQKIGSTAELDTEGNILIPLSKREERIIEDLDK